MDTPNTYSPSVDASAGLDWPASIIERQRKAWASLLRVTVARDAVILELAIEEEEGSDPYNNV